MISYSDKSSSATSQSLLCYSQKIVHCYSFILLYSNKVICLIELGGHYQKEWWVCKWVCMYARREPRGIHESLQPGSSWNLKEGHPLFSLHRGDSEKRETFTGNIQMRSEDTSLCHYRKLQCIRQYSRHTLDISYLARGFQTRRMREEISWHHTLSYSPPCMVDPC